jgi:hypothetical protein
VPDTEESASRAPAAAATLTSATTSCVTWAVAHYCFRGQIPPEVYGFVQLVVPAALGWLGGCITHRRQAEHAAQAAEAQR